MSESKQKNILFVARDDGGCGYYRCEQPAKFLNRAGLANALSVLKNPSQEQLLQADLVVMQEMGTVEAASIAKFMHEHGVPFILEFDDFLQHVSPHNEWGYPMWNPSTLHLYRSMEMLKNSYGATVATGQLAREYFPYNPNLFVLPNYLDKDIWDVPTTKRSDGKIRIGWAGGNAHADDLHMVSTVLQRIVKEFNGKVIFETMGMTKQELGQAFPMESSSENACPSCGFEGTLHHFPGEVYTSYPQVMGSRGWDLAIAPVIDNAFGNAKSDLKIKEYAALGIPVMASDVRPYRDAKANGAPIDLADTYQEWYEGLKALIGDKTARQRKAREMKTWSEKNWIQDRIGERFEVYQSLIEAAERVVGDKATRLQKLKGVQ